MKFKFLKMAFVGLALSVSAIANAGLITFGIQYDDTFGRGMEGNIIGNGTFSFDGELSTGSFLLRDLANISYESSIGGVFTSTADIATLLSAVSLRVFEELGIIYATFTGLGSGPAASQHGSLDFSTGLTHEPGRLGLPCCGGTDLSRLYQFSGLKGSYQMRLEVPEPPTFAILGLGLMGLAALRFKKQAKLTVNRV